MHRGIWRDHMLSGEGCLTLIKEEDVRASIGITLRLDSLLPSKQNK
jgi:hypothetical protein